MEPPKETYIYIEKMTSVQPRKRRALSFQQAKALRQLRAARSLWATQFTSVAEDNNARESKIAAVLLQLREAVHLLLILTSWWPRG